jgi:hypothetical protein
MHGALQLVKTAAVAQIVVPAALRRRWKASASDQETVVSEGRQDVTAGVREAISNQRQHIKLDHVT